MIVFARSSLLRPRRCWNLQRVRSMRKLPAMNEFSKARRSPRRTPAFNGKWSFRKWFGPLQSLPAQARFLRLRVVLDLYFTNGPYPPRTLARRILELSHTPSRYPHPLNSLSQISVPYLPRFSRELVGHHLA